MGDYNNDGQLESQYQSVS